MSGILKWFAKTDEGYVPASVQSDDDEYAVEAPGVLPAHVEEFLAMKSAADV